MNLSDFKPKPEKQKFQVRFWANEFTYKDFFAAVKRRGLSVHQVFGEFILWFIIEDEKERNKVKTPSEDVSISG